jgi:hypothetical protein
MVKVFRFGCDRVANRLDRWDQRVLHPLSRRNVHRCGKRIVRRLRHVDVVVGMHRLLRTHLAARKLDRTIGDDLIHVHVRLRAAARLPDSQGKLVIQLAGNDFIGGLSDQLREVGGKFSQILIYQRASLLKRAKGVNQFGRHDVASNIEMQQRALCLRPPINICRDVNLAHAVGFGAGFPLGLRDGLGRRGHYDLLRTSVLHG